MDEEKEKLEAVCSECGEPLCGCCGCCGNPACVNASCPEMELEYAVD